MTRASLALLLLPGAVLADTTSADDRLFFEKSVRPLLVARCQSCHGAASKKQRGGLLLDSRAGLLKGGDSGPAVVPAQPDKSLLVQAVRHEHATLQMPPAGKLPAREVALLEEWVRRGAPFPGPSAGPPSGGMDIRTGRKFWSFQPLQAAALPRVKDHAWPRRRIDHFLLAEMERRALSPSAEADRRTLIRRVTFDLTGLPPTPEEVEAFVHDTRADAYERLIDRLLTSPGHGERWARLWLDLVRYCDVAEPWAGLKGSPYFYRDWVVDALNTDLGYDHFVQRQLAADQLADAPPGDRAALGFLGISPTYWKELKLAPEAIMGVVAEEWEERIHTLTSMVLGLTVGCARCHDHKFDPISTEDYYALAGVFASVRQVDLTLPQDGPNKARLMPGVTDASLHVLADGPHRTKLDWRPEAQDVAVQVRGNPARPGPVVPRRFLAVLSSDTPRPFRHGSGRLDLARALFAEGAPLAARVIVNRVWKHHFGEGLVRTPSDFGSQGERPTHPELLEDLAARFVGADWSLKWLHREIVLSAAYRQASRASAAENRWLAGMSRRRLDVEAWRDAILAVAGGLRQQVGGPPADLGQATNDRRTLYGTVKRRELHDLLRLHDFPDPTTHSPARTPTTTPLQQLFVLNSPFMRQQAAALARRLKSEGKDDRARVVRAYALLFGRPPTPTELTLGTEFLAAGPWEQYAQVLLASNEMLYVD